MRHARCALLWRTWFAIGGLAFGVASLFAQAPPPGGAKQETQKAGESAKSRPTLDKMKLPPGSVVIVVDDVKDALGLKPNLVVMTPEEYKKLLDTKDQLDKLLKADKKTAHACKLTGSLQGDFVLLRAEIAFTTEQPRATVVLGLQGALLTDEGQLDGQVPFLDFGEEGFLVRVDKEGPHQLVLNLKVPVAFKRSAAAGAGGERGIDLGLPGAAVTTLALELPPGVKEVRWNDTLEKQRGRNHWELALGKIKTLSLAWKEPAALPGTTPLLSADSQIVVKLDENNVLLSADIILEDPRAQAKEWQLLLPPNARVEVKAPTGISADVIAPDGPRPHHVIRLTEPTSERITVHVQVRHTRPLTALRLPVGPFFVLGAFRQEGTITVLAPPDALRGQRLVYHRFGDIYQRAVPKGPAGTDVAAVFHAWSMPARPAKGAAAKVPLELELKAEKALADLRVEHGIQVKPRGAGWFVEVTTTLQMDVRPDTLDLQLPRLRIPRIGALGIGPGVPFPASLSWLPLAPPSGRTYPQAVLLDFTVKDDGTELKLSPPDPQRRTRLTWNRSQGNATTVVLIGKYLVPRGADRLHVDLPRPLNVLDQGAKVLVQVDEQLELLVGAAGLEGPAPDKQRVEVEWDSFPESVEFAWKPYRPEFPVAGLTDIWLHDRVADVQHQVTFIVPQKSAAPGLPQSGQMRFRVPAAIRELAVVSGGKLVLHDPGRESAWIVPQAEPFTRGEIVLRYDCALPKKDGPLQKGASRTLQVPLIWPEGTTREEAKVRVWSETGTKPLLVEQPLEERWRDYGIEIVPGSDVLPALVLQGSGLNLALALRLAEPVQARLASMVCDRGLIQVTIDEDGNHTYRARYLIRKLNARNLDVEFPMPAANCLQNVWLDKLKINNWEPLDPVPNIAQIPVNPRRYHQPVVLELEYKLPASFTDSKRFWRSTLHAPQFRGDIFLGRIRWQLSMPYTWVALIPGGNVDYRWGIQGWLLGPEPSVTSADLEAWLTGREAADTGTPVSLAFARTGQESVQVLHLSRQMWLLLCSGLVLALGLALYLSRATFWLAAVALGIAVLAVGLAWPGWLPALVFGCQPGVVVLAALVGIQWMLQERYRRQLVFMPGFTRLKANSSLTRLGGSGARREPSTIDAPVPLAGSSSQKGQNSTKGS